jgi:hypothetical protein
MVLALNNLPQGEHKIIYDAKLRLFIEPLIKELSTI